MDKRKKIHSCFLSSFILSFVSCLLPFIWFPRPIIAQEPQFALTQEIIYQVHDNGDTSVTQNFTFTNLTSDFFPQQYVFSVGKANLTNLRAVDRLGPLQLQTQEFSGQKTIKVNFNDQAVGLGKVLRWNLYFDEPDITLKEGRLWSVSIPPYIKIPGLTDLAVRLIVPESFGKNVYLKPQTKTAEYFWDLNQIGTSSIRAVFDPQNSNPVSQTYDFDLKYHLYNSRLYPVTMQLALPPDGASQKIFLTSLTPTPTDVILDSNKNWLAIYQLGPVSRLDVQATGSAIVFLHPASQLTTQDNSPFLSDQKYWPVTDPEILKIARNLGSAEQIYKYVATTLSVNPKVNFTSRLGARNTLLTQSGNATDFLDLFVTLSRATQTPAREVDGYLTGVLSQRYQWPQYFSQNDNSWLSIDPFLAKISNNLDYFSTLDLNHVIFFIRASDFSPVFPDQISFKPVTKNLKIDQWPNVIAGANLPAKITSGFEASGQVYVQNAGPTLFSSQPINLRDGQLELTPNLLLSGDLPPFGHQDFPLRFQASGFTTKFNDIITLQFGLQKQDYSIEVSPIYQNGYIFFFGGLIFLGILSIIAQITRSLSLQKRQRHSHLRGEGKKSS